MKDLDDLRRKRKAAAEAMSNTATAISDLEAAGTADGSDEMNAAISAFDDAKTTFEASDKAVKRAETVEAAQVAAAGSGDEGSRTTVPAVPVAESDKGLTLGFMVHALTRSGGDKAKAMAALEADGHSAVSAALSAGDETAGGVIIPRAQAAEMIGLLQARAVVRASGARIVEMPAGQLRRGRMTGGATASYIGENGKIPFSQATTDAVDQNFKTLTGLIAFSNALLQFSSPSTAGMFRDDLISATRLREDLAFVRGDGTGDKPKGLRNWALAGNWQAGVLATVAAADAALRLAVSKVEDADVQMIAPGWIMRASAKNWLAGLKDGNGQKVYPTIDDKNQLMGFPIKTTSQIPNNLGVGGDETEITFADFNEIAIGDAMTLTLASSSEAGYMDEGANYVSAFQNNQTLMRAVSHHDLAPLHDVAISGFNGVGWSL